MAASKRKASGAAAPARRTVGDCPSLEAAAESFLRGAANFESSIVVDALLAEVRGCATGDELFMLPLRYKILPMAGALEWALFLSVAVGRAAEADGHGIAPPRADESLRCVASVYDLGIADLVDPHFEDVDEDDEDGEDDGEGEAAKS